jgi:hypothetical protein
MKKIYLILAITLSVSTIKAQVIKELPVDESGGINFSEVVEVANQSKDDLYLKAKAFFVNNFKSANNVIQMDDKEDGIIIGKGNSDFSISPGMGVNVYMKINFTIKIQSKDNKFKYDIYDIYYSGSYGDVPAETWFSEKNYYKSNGKPRGVNEQYKDKTLAKINSIKQSLIAQMAKVNQVSKEW